MRPTGEAFRSGAGVEFIETSLRVTNVTGVSDKEAVK